MARPLHLPVLRHGQACPTSGGSPINTHGFVGVAVAQGPGPVHPLVGDTHGIALLISPTQVPGWLALKTLWISEPRYQGPFLVRVRRLDGNGPAGVLDDPHVSSFYVRRGPEFKDVSGYRYETGGTWVKHPGCLAWQVDGLGFSHVIVVRAVCRPPTDTTAGCVMPRRPAR